MSALLKAGAALAAGTILACAAASPAAAALTWYSSKTSFLAAAPSSADPTGMSAVTTDAQAIALMEASPSPWRNNAAEDQNDIVLGALTISEPHGPITSHGFGMNIDGSVTGASVGFTGASYRMGNPAHENHSYLIGGDGATAFGFNLYEPRSVSECGGVPCVMSRFTFEAFDASGATLGSHSIDFGADAATVFVGLTSTTAFSRLRVTETNLGGFGGYNCCLYDNEYFGNYLMTAAGAEAEAAVPEPATWAMMIGGFGLVGGRLRRRRFVQHVTA